MPSFPSLPPVVLVFMTISFLLSIPMLVLSPYNYGALSVIINHIVSALTLLSHICILANIWEQQRIPKGCPPPLAPQQLSIIYRSKSAIIWSIVTIQNLIAFGMTLQVTLEGPESLLPAERDPNMTLAWNFRVQVAQSALLGVQSLVLSILVSICVVGRNRIQRAEKDTREAKECGLESMTESVSSEVKA